MAFIIKKKFSYWFLSIMGNKSIGLLLLKKKLRIKTPADASAGVFLLNNAEFI